MTTHTEQQAKYQTIVMEKDARPKGCKCAYSEKKYMNGEFEHDKDCPAPYYENLPNVNFLLALRNVGGRSTND